MSVAQGYRNSLSAKVFGAGTACKPRAKRILFRRILRNSPSQPHPSLHRPINYSFMKKKWKEKNREREERGVEKRLSVQKDELTRVSEIAETFIDLAH